MIKVLLWVWWLPPINSPMVTPHPSRSIRGHPPINIDLHGGGARGLVVVRRVPVSVQVRNVRVGEVGGHVVGVGMGVGVAVVVGWGWGE